MIELLSVIESIVTEYYYLGHVNSVGKVDATSIAIGLF